MLLERQRSYSCIRPDTYKYFFTAQSVVDVWRRLEARYGAIEHNEGFRTIQIDASRFVLRAVAGGNPITVIRKRRCRPSDVDELHAIMGCREALDELESDLGSSNGSRKP